MSQISAVITTKAIVSKRKNILIIYRDHEGDFQFLDGDDVNESDAMVVSLAQVLELDSSIKDVVEKLEFNKTAHRKSVSGSWEIF